MIFGSVSLVVMYRVWLQLLIKIFRVITLDYRSGRGGRCGWYCWTYLKKEFEGHRSPAGLGGECA